MMRIHDEEAPRTEAAQVLPDGVFEIHEEDARFLEEYPDHEHEISEGLKLDHRGWWAVSFDPPVPIRAADIVLMKSELDRLLNATPAPGTIKDVPPAQTDRSHVSDELVLLNQAARRWWANADRHDPATHPGNADVAAWLIEKGMTKSLAERAASIIRPKWAHTGRKPDA